MLDARRDDDDEEEDEEEVEVAELGVRGADCRPFEGDGDVVKSELLLLLVA